MTDNNDNNACTHMHTLPFPWQILQVYPGQLVTLVKPSKVASVASLPFLMPSHRGQSTENVAGIAVCRKCNLGWVYLD